MNKTIYAGIIVLILGLLVGYSAYDCDDCDYSKEVYTGVGASVVGGLGLIAYGKKDDTSFWDNIDDLKEEIVEDVKESIGDLDDFKDELADTIADEIKKALKKYRK